MTTAAEAAARDQAAIAAGTPSFDLMLRAGTAAAALVLRDHGDRFGHGVALFAGAGNNGGDAYVVAAQLARAGITVRLHAVAPPRTDEAQRAAALASPYLRHGLPTGTESVVVDGILGTGHRGALRDAVATACTMLGHAHDRGATVVALDVPTGLDATTGAIAEGSIPAATTLSFGTAKRGQLLQRAHTGRLVVLDIGLGRSIELDDAAWRIAHDDSLAARLPATAWNAHKGLRGRVALVGGASGMAGAIVLATRAALASGAGLATAWVDAPSVSALQHGAVQAVTHPWPLDAAPDEDSAATPWGDAVAIGPGLGRSATSRALLLHALRSNPGVPILLDADALTLLSGQEAARDPADLLRALCDASAAVVLTPHPGEFARLIGKSVPQDWQRKADVLSAFAIRARAVVLLKGAPTLVASPDGSPPFVVPRGTPLLATGGSGDVLSGIIATLLAQGAGAMDAAVLGASAHGLAAELATARSGTVRGVALERLLEMLPDAWRRIERPATLHREVLLELPPVAS